MRGSFNLLHFGVTALLWLLKNNVLFLFSGGGGVKSYWRDITPIKNGILRIAEYCKFVKTADQRFYGKSAEFIVQLRDMCISAANDLTQVIQDGKTIGLVQPAVEVRLPDSDAAKACKYMYSQYAEVLLNPQFQSDVLYQSRCCATILQRWFDCRFVKTHHSYNISYFPDFVFSFVLAFSEAYESNTEGEFLHMFELWEKDVLDPASNNTFSTPKDVYLVFNKVDKSEHITVTAYDIWEDMKNYIYVNLFRDSNLRWKLDANAFRWYMQYGSADVQAMLYKHQVDAIQKG